MKIVCGTDFSEPAKEAADIAAAMAAKLMVPLHLIHCVSDWLVPADLPMNDFLEPAARRSLDAESLRISRPGLEIITELLHGNAPHHLLSATNSDTLFLVVGSTGRGNVQKLLLGSISEHVAQNCNAPVLVVRKAESLLSWLLNEVPIRTLCAAELTDSGDDAVMAIQYLSRLGGLSLELGHVIPTDMLSLQATGFLKPPLGDGPEAPESVVSLQRDMAEQSGRALGIMPRAVHVRESLGNPAYEFLSLAHERQADLIVLGSHHRHGLHRFVHPSFSRRILRHATTNVLCVPARIPVDLAEPLHSMRPPAGLISAID